MTFYYLFLSLNGCKVFSELVFSSRKIFKKEILKTIVFSKGFDAFIHFIIFLHKTLSAKKKKRKRTIKISIYIYLIS